MSEYQRGYEAGWREGFDRGVEEAYNNIKRKKIRDDHDRIIGQREEYWASGQVPEHAKRGVEMGNL